MLSHPSNTVSFINTILLITAILVMGVLRVFDVTERQEKWSKVEEFIEAHNVYHSRCEHLTQSPESE